MIIGTAVAASSAVRRSRNIDRSVQEDIDPQLPCVNFDHREIESLISQLASLFPNYERDILIAVLECNSFALDASIDQFLAMSDANKNEAVSEVPAFIPLQQPLNPPTEAQTTERLSEENAAAIAEALYTVTDELLAFMFAVNNPFHIIYDVLIHIASLIE